MLSKKSQNRKIVILNYTSLYHTKKIVYKILLANSKINKSDTNILIYSNFE